METLLKGYLHDTMHPIGELENKVTTGTEIRNLNLLVMPRAGPPLLGRQWLCGRWPLKLNQSVSNSIFKLVSVHICDHLIKSFQTFLVVRPYITIREKFQSKLKKAPVR